MFRPALYDIFLETLYVLVLRVHLLKLMHCHYFCMLVVVCISLILTCKVGISSSLSLLFCQDRQSAMNRSGPGLYMILTLY